MQITSASGRHNSDIGGGSKRRRKMRIYKESMRADNVYKWKA